MGRIGACSAALLLASVLFQGMPAQALGAGRSPMSTPLVTPKQLAGSEPGTPANPPGSIAPDVAGTLLGAAPVTTSAVVSQATGGDVVAGNIGVSIPAAALAGVQGPVSVRVKAHPPNETIPGGPFQYSPNGAVAAIAVADRAGRSIAAFAAPITLILSYNAADLSMARSNSGLLTAAYQVGATSPAGNNPLGYPAGTWVLFAPSAVSQDLTAGTVTVRTRTLGAIVAVFTQPLGYVRTIRGSVPELSGWGPGATVLGYRSRGIDLEVVAPQVGNRLFVRDPLTRNYAYVDAAAVGPGETHYDQVSQGHDQTAQVTASGE